MINDMGKVYNLKITTFSPVHIGDIIPFEPTGYVIYNPDEQGKAGQNNKVSDEDVIECPECGYVNPLNKVMNNPYCLGCDAELDLPANRTKNEPKVAEKISPSYLYTFNPKQLSEALSDLEKKQLLEVARSGNFYKLEEFFKSKTAKIVQQASKHALVCPVIANQYNQKYGNEAAQKGKENKFDIGRNISNPVSGMAYIPGSSLKGALRTALMSESNSKIGLTYKNIEQTKGNKIAYDASKAEKKLYDYGNPQSDPFKYLKISDTVPQDMYLSEISVARNYKRYSGKSQMPEFIEVIPHNTVFLTELVLAKNALSKEVQNLPDTMSDIRTACNSFYGDILAQEKLYVESQALYENLQRAAQKPNAFLLRVGKHSGAESVTIDGLRRIKNRVSGKYMDHSTTYWLAENGTEKLPFGWCVVEFEEVR